MKNINKIAMLFGVALVLFVPLLGVAPYITGQALAIVAADPTSNNSSGPVDNVSIDQQLQSYIYVRAFMRCMQLDGFANTTPFEVNSYNLFHKSYETYLGIYDTDDYNGKTSCNDTKNPWVKNAYALWGMGTDPVSNICNSGYKQTGAPKGQSVQDCIASGGAAIGNSPNGFDFNGSSKEAIAAFLASVNRSFYGGAVGLPKLTDPMKYLYYSQSFISLCGGKADSSLDGIDSRKTAQDYIKGSASGVKIGGDPHIFRMVDATGNATVTYRAEKNDGDRVSTRTSDSLGNNDLSCGYLVNEANKVAQAYAFAITASANPEDIAVGSPGDNAAIDAKCGGFSITNALSIDWIVCPIIQGTIYLANSLEDSIAGYLCIDEASIFEGAKSTCGAAGSTDTASSSTSFKDAWNVFRLFALGLLAIAGLLMIISQALGFEIFDAYTIKKTLPRILIAGIGISLSWSLLQFLVTASNQLGIGVRSLIYAPFTASGIDKIGLLNGGAGAIGIIFGAGAFVALGALGLLSFLATAALAIIIAFFTLIIRNMLVIFLIIFAPIAIAAYILPNTEKYWKLWWEWLFKALMVFPIITAMIALGHVFAAISYAAGGGFLASFVVFAAYFAPYFLIPTAFRFAGGALSTISGAVSDRSRGGFDRLSGFRKNRGAQNIHKLAEGNRFNSSNAIGRRLNSASVAAVTASKAGANPVAMRSRFNAAHAQHTFDQAEELRTKNPDFALGAQDDRILRAVEQGQGRTDIRRRLTAEGMAGSELDNAVGIAERMQNSGSREAVRTAAVMQRFATGTGFNDENGEFDAGAAMNAIRDASHGDRALAGRLLGQAKGVATQAGQGSFGGASYGALNAGLSQSFAGQAVDGNAIALDAFMSNDAVTNVRARDPHVRAMTRAVTQRLSDIDSGIVTPATGERGRLVAQLENFQQSAAMYAAPQRGAIVNNEVQAAARTRQDVRTETSVYENNPDSQVFDISTRQPLAAPTADVDQYKRNKNVNRGDPNDPGLL